MPTSVRNYAVIWTGGRAGPSGAITGGGGAFLLEAGVHALGGAEHTGDLDVGRLATTVVDPALVAAPDGGGGVGFRAAWGPKWIDFTPDWYALGSPPAIGNGTFVGKYAAVPNDPSGEFPDGWMLDFYILVIFGSTTDPGSGDWYFQIPHAFAAGTVDAVSGAALPLWGVVGGVSFPGLARVGGDVSLIGELLTPAGVRWSATVPGVWAAGDQFTIAGQLLITQLD
jgi:hypothetical protein